jgi:hypothetical protein
MPRTEHERRTRRLRQEYRNLLRNKYKWGNTNLCALSDIQLGGVLNDMERMYPDGERIPLPQYYIAMRLWSVRRANNPSPDVAVAMGG